MRNFKQSVFIFLLTISFVGCQVKEKETEPAIENFTIYCIGDSTMSDKKNPDKNPEHGWAQVLPTFFEDNVTIDNRAVNGRSSRSFIGEDRWQSVYDSLKKGDYVFIQFGHNDQKFKAPTRFTNPQTGYRNNLIKFVNESREKGATPILFTSIVRRNFNEYGVLIDTHGEYPLQVRLVAQEYNVPLIDLQYHTELLEESYGEEGSKKLHLHFEEGEHPYYSKGRKDNTHLSILGATEISKIVVEQLKLKKLPLAKWAK